MKYYNSNIHIKGDWSRWVINNKVFNGPAFFKSKKTGLINIPQTGWQYVDDDGWHDDITLRVSGKNISCSGEILFII